MRTIQLDVRDLRLVEAIADFGTLTRAAQHLHFTQSALSHQLANLERRLGAPIFHRAGRTMVPTHVGERLTARAADTLRQLRAIEHEVTAMAKGREAVLRLATECHTCYHWLPPVFRQFAQQHPEVKLRIVPGATSRPLRALRAGKLDLAIITSQVNDRRIVTTPLFEDELVLVVAKGDRLASGVPVQPGDLKDRQIFLYVPAEESHLFKEILAPAGVSARQVSQIPLTEAILELVRAGMGVTILARWAAEPYLERGDVRAIALAPSGAWRRWAVATRSLRGVPEYVGELVRLLQKVRPPSSSQQPRLAAPVATTSLKRSRKVS